MRKIHPGLLDHLIDAYQADPQVDVSAVGIEDCRQVVEETLLVFLKSVSATASASAHPHAPGLEGLRSWLTHRLRLQGHGGGQTVADWLDRLPTGHPIKQRGLTEMDRSILAPHVEVALVHFRLRAQEKIMNQPFF